MLMFSVIASLLKLNEVRNEHQVKQEEPTHLLTKPSNKCGWAINVDLSAKTLLVGYSDI